MLDEIGRRPRMRRFIQWMIGIAAINAAILLFLAWLLTGFTLSGIGSAFAASIIISLTLAICWPFIYRLSSVLHPILFPIVSFGLTGLVVFLIGRADIDGVQISDFWAGLWVCVGL